jgi:hypothetical protein
MKIALVRHLDLGHILWCRRVGRIERAHRIRIVRDVQKLLDLVIPGVIDFGHIRFEVGDRVVEVFPEDELVGAELLGCCVPRYELLKAPALSSLMRTAEARASASASHSDFWQNEANPSDPVFTRKAGEYATWNSDPSLEPC